MIARTSALGHTAHPHILFVAGRELTYTRNDVLTRALRRQGTALDVIGVSQQVRSISRTTAHLLPMLASRLLRHRYDLVMVGFYGYLLAPAVRMFTQAPLLFDAFVSNYDTLCFDRQVVAPTSLLGRAIYQFDAHICRSVHHLLLDTPQHVAYFVDTFGLDARRISWIPVGCNEEIFYPRPAPSKHDTTVVLHYSTFLPLHGVDVILRAAAHLRAKPVHFRLIGDGPLFDAMKGLAAELHLKNVEFLPPVPLAFLAEEIANAHICLGGHFGSSGKSQRVVPGKIYQMMASRRAIIAADSPANRALLAHGISALLTPAGDPEQLASAILHLHENPALCASLADGAYHTFEMECSEQVIGARLSSIMTALLA
ncbi:MAG TPA: hypothetical protein DCL15_08705 [Chloroflexi bacterium]|nr:hypothetical protein [Chloroflexota bacterium]HHW88811.1 glycosyltransferase family 4 protein [Chloroflexota bacterium]